MKKKIVAFTKHFPTLHSFLVYSYLLLKRIQRSYTESDEREKYYKQIEQIKKAKKIIVDLEFGGIGDCLIWSNIPCLLKKEYDVDFYLSPQSKTVIRQKDTFKLCFEMNPYFKGFADDTAFFHPNIFESEKTWYTFFTDKEGPTVIENLELQFKLNGTGVPRLYYQPNILTDYKNSILIDSNTISGKKFGWTYNDNAFETEAKQHLDEKSHIDYVDPSKQDLFKYIDMIYSCKYLVCTFSGSASIAACFNKQFSVIWPNNARNQSNYQFRYKKSAGKYVM